MPNPRLKSSSLREDVHFRVLRLLSENPSASQRDISNALGVSLGLVNYCVNALVEKGAVKISNFRAADNKLRYAYVLTPSGLSEKMQLTGRFLQRKMEEFEALRAEIEALKGEADGEGDAQDASFLTFGMPDRQDEDLVVESQSSSQSF